jgi:Raf kinase inhibitor-like YbhB/YbcL family protein
VPRSALRPSSPSHLSAVVGRTALRLAGTVFVVAVVVSCATGDGRELRPPTVPAPTTTTPGEFGDPVEFPTDEIELLPDFVEFELFAAWPDGSPVPARHTCDDAEVSPALTWTGVPDDTIELAITVVDEQTAGLVHWVVTGIDPSSVSTLEGQVPPGASERLNSFDISGWTGPCPPEGVEHTYRFTVHAIDQQLEGLEDASGSAAVALIEGLALESASMTGTYSR